MKVLILGGAGYIGAQLLDELVLRDDISEIVIYDNLSRANFSVFFGNRYKDAERIRFVNGELLDSRQLRKALDGTDIVYHLAAKVTTPFANTDPHFYEQVNHWGTAELVYAIEESEVSHVVYISSTSVYGSSSEEVDEKTVPNPRTFYGISKLRGEEHVRRLADSRKTHILRCGNVYGFNPSLRFDAVINKFVFEANFNKQLQIHGDGKQHRAFVHVERTGKVLANLLDGAVDPGTYNLVDRNLGVLDIVDELKMLIPPLEFIFINQHLKLRQLKVRPNDDLMKKLGVEQNTTFREELEEFLEKLRF